MRRNRDLTVESLEGKLLQAISAVGVGAHILPAAHVQGQLPHGPSIGTGFTPFASNPAASIVSQGHLPHGPSTGVGFAAF